MVFQCLSISRTIGDFTKVSVCCCHSAYFPRKYMMKTVTHKVGCVQDTQVLARRNSMIASVAKEQILLKKMLKNYHEPWKQSSHIVAVSRHHDVLL